MASVTLNLYATLRQHIGGAGSIEIEFARPTTVADLLRTVSVPTDAVRIVFIDHRPAELDCPLAGGETVGVFPAIGGG